MWGLSNWFMDTCSKPNSLSGRKTSATFPWQRSSIHSGKSSLLGSFWLFFSKERTETIGNRTPNRHQEISSNTVALLLGPFTIKQFSSTRVSKKLLPHHFWTGFLLCCMGENRHWKPILPKEAKYLLGACRNLSTDLDLTLKDHQIRVSALPRGKKMGKKVGEGRSISITIIMYRPQLMDSCCQSPECTKRPQPAPWDPTCISCLWIQEVCFCWDLGLQSLPEQLCLSLVLWLVPSPGGTSAPHFRYLLSSPCLQPRLLVLLTAFPGSGSLRAWDCSFCILYISIHLYFLAGEGGRVCFATTQSQPIVQSSLFPLLQKQHLFQEL